VRLTPKELDRLTIFSAAELARRRRARGLKLNHPEAVALICDEVMEEARAGRSYREVLEHGRGVLSRADVLDGVPELVGTIQVEAVFEDGTKLLTLHRPIR
jgi:urease gamma subunit